MAIFWDWPLPLAAKDPARAIATNGLSRGTRFLSIAAVSGLLAVMSAPAQQPQFSQGFSGAGQNGPRNPAEMSAYSAAIGQPDPGVRVSAIQQFLVNYPNSSLRQPAIAQMMLAKRQGHTGSTDNSGMGGTMAPQSGPTPGMGGTTASQPMPTSSVPAAAQAFPPQASGPPRDSLLQKPAKPADVTVASHSLTIKADNSALSQILREVSGSTGMKVEGLSSDERIFGTFGPGDVRDVLLSLLQGSGYNVLMVGETHGAPRELSLSQRVATNTAAPATAQGNSRDDDDDGVEQEVQQTPPEPPQAQPLPGNPQNPDGMQPRSPQEIQQELLRLRQQQQPQPNPPQ